MKKYSLSSEGLKRVKEQGLQRTSLVFILSLIIVAFVMNAPVNREGTTSLLFVIPVSLFVIIAAAFSLYKGQNAQKAIWESIRIEVEDNSITRQQIFMAGIRISREEVKSIKETGQGLCIFTSDRNKSILIPVELDKTDYEEIKQTLSSWMNIEPKSPTQKRADLLLTILVVLGYGILFFSWSGWLVLFVSVVMVGFYAYMYWNLQQHKSVDPKTKRNYAFILGFVVLISSMKLCLLFGIYEPLILFIVKR